MPIKPLALSVLLATTALTGAHAEAFNRIASFPVARNTPADADPMSPTSPEIIAATDDGMMLVYSDSPAQAIGMVDITDPKAPKPAGRVDVGGEPTSVTVVGGIAIAAVNTSESETRPSGLLKLIDLEQKTVSDSCDLGGQPDSIAVADDLSFIAVAIENERDEDLNDGRMPQLPAGNVKIIPLAADGVPDCAAIITADLTGLAEVAPEDPEPEFVAINENNEIAVTLQENNHIAILAPDGHVLSHFSAGSVALDNVDVKEDGALTFDGSIDRKREPDAVKWVDVDHIVIANEGDYEGGSRGFTIFDRDGNVSYESGMSMEYAIASIGHYPEGRSENKGNEPEGLEVATFDGTQYIFVLSERASVVAVYADDEEAPELVGLLPSGIGPEGAVAIPERGLFVTANETDLREDGLAGAHVMIYEYTEDGQATYPTIESVAGEEAPLGFGALSGLAADPAQPAALYAVSDSVYAMAPTIYVIDAAETPALIVAAIPVTRDGAPAQKLDLEGITTDGEGGFWLASEGRTDRMVPHALIHVDVDGAIQQEVPFPAELLAGETRFGAEGIAKVGDTLWMAIQREWGDDPKGEVKLLAYNLMDKSWGAVRYPLEPAQTGWMGLSEITVRDDDVYLIERDNQIGEAARVKAIYRVPLAELKPAPLGGDLPVVTKTLVRDLIPDLKRWNGYVQDKVEGFAIDKDGTAFIVTDNDGVDDSSGETLFWSVPDFDR